MTDLDKFIAESDHFIASLHENQCYLGRMRVTARRKDAVDLFTLTDKERLDFFAFGGRIKGVLDKLFHPDLYNYLVAGNRNPHFHLHLIPRYAESRDFQGLTFTDTNWGRNYAPYDTDFTIPEGRFIAIREAIKTELK